MASDVQTHVSSIEARLNSNWTTTDIAWPGVEFEPGNDPWVRATVLWGDAFEYDRGASLRNQLVGVLDISVFGKPGTGYGTLYGYANTLRDLFNHDTVGSVRFGPAGPPRAVNTAESDWLQLNITCPFTVEETA